jgi:ribosomal protein S18 acetylase RimI-like enzyme
MHTAAPIHTPQPVIRALTRADGPAWKALWRLDVGASLDDAVMDHTLTLMGAVGPIIGLTAEKDGQMVGLLHAVVHPVAGALAPVCYMQDVFVHPDYRRQGIARALVAGLAHIGRARGFDRLYWLTEQTNTAAQSLYKDLGLKLDFSFHILPLGMLDRIRSV